MSLIISTELEKILSILFAEKRVFEIFKDLIEERDNVDAQNVAYKDVENEDVQNANKNIQAFFSNIIKKVSKDAHAISILSDYK